MTKFTYSNAVSSVEDSFAASNTSWAGQTTTQSPFFLMSNTKQVSFSSGNAYFGDSGLSLSVRENSLSSRPEKWYTSSDFNANSKQIT